MQSCLKSGVDLTSDLQNGRRMNGELKDEEIDSKHRLLDVNPRLSRRRDV